MMRWLLGQHERAVYIAGWNAAVADKHAEATARMLLGWCGPAVVSLSAAQRARKAAR
jgi:hypothetical protein